MTMEDQIRQLIAQRLEQYLAGEPSQWSGLMAQARHLQALPIGLDLFTALFLTPEGLLYAWDLMEESGEPQVVSDEVHRIAVFRIAAQWFPELKRLIPEPPEGAQECSACWGTGTQLLPAMSGNPGRYICFACRGVGWQTEATP
jgi:hypothetical protein